MKQVYEFKSYDVLPIYLKRKKNPTEENMEPTTALLPRKEEYK